MWSFGATGLIIAPMMWRCLLAAGLACVVFATAVGCGRPARNVETTPAKPDEVGAPRPAVLHTVEPGQTLWRIARIYGVGVDAIARENGIEDPDRVAAGTRLRIPGTEGRQASGGSGAATAPATAEDWTWPVSGGDVLSYFGAPRRTHEHQGIDIRGVRGQPVVAARAGRVVYSGATMRGYGKTVILEHGKGLRSLYAHNSTLLVVTGQRVRRGQAIARVGRTGNATTEHCHFEIRRHEVPVNPLLYLSAQFAEREAAR